MEEIKTIEIHDKVFEETYTAHVQRNGTSWLGWFPEVPKVKCEERTEEVLLKTLKNRLYEALVAEEEAWEKQFRVCGWSFSKENIPNRINKQHLLCLSSNRKYTPFDNLKIYLDFLRGAFWHSRIDMRYTTYTR